MTSVTRRWIAGRVPVAPPAIVARIDAALVETAAGSSPDPVVDDCLRAAEGILARLLADGATNRSAALDLLTADALATYAFEAASENPDALVGQARAAMARLSALAADAQSASTIGAA